MQVRSYTIKPYRQTMVRCSHAHFTSLTLDSCSFENRFLCQGHWDSRNIMHISNGAQIFQSELNALRGLSLMKHKYWKRVTTTPICWSWLGELMPLFKQSHPRLAKSRIQALRKSSQQKYWSLGWTSNPFYRTPCGRSRNSRCKVSSTHAYLFQSVTRWRQRPKPVCSQNPSCLLNWDVQPYSSQQSKTKAIFA